MSPGFAGLRVTFPLEFTCESGENVKYLWTFLICFLPPFPLTERQRNNIFKGILF